MHTQVIHISNIIAAAAQFSRSANGIMEIVFISIKVFKYLSRGKIHELVAKSAEK